MDYLELADRFTCELRWMPGNECLNPVDINRIPRWYPGSWKEWIQDVTTFTSLFPEEWIQVHKEYCTLAHGRFKKINHCTELQFELTDEGYLRKIGEQDVFLRIRIQNTNLSVPELAKKMECESFLGFEEYWAYCTFPKDLRKAYLKTIESWVADRVKTARPDIVELLYEVTFVTDYSDSAFEGNEIFVDALNQLYFVL